MSSQWLCVHMVVGCSYSAVLHSPRCVALHIHMSVESTDTGAVLILRGAVAGVCIAASRVLCLQPYAKHGWCLAAGVVSVCSVRVFSLRVCVLLV